MKETEKIMKQVDKEERRRSKQQAAVPAYPTFSKSSKASSAATTPTLPRYCLAILTGHSLLAMLCMTALALATQQNHTLLGSCREPLYPEIAQDFLKLVVLQYL